MGYFKDRFREGENTRRKEVLFDFKHLNCGECWSHRTNHAPTLLIGATLIGGILCIWAVVLAILGHEYFFYVLGGYILVYVFVLPYFYIPPHKRVFLKKVRRRS